MDEDYAATDPVATGVEPPLPGREDVFGIRPDRVPSDARAVFDDARSVIAGWQWNTPDGWVVLGGPDGSEVSRSEKGLESPLFDPLDLLFLFAGVLEGLGKGAIRGGSRLIEGRAAGRFTLTQMTAHEAAVLSGKMLALDQMPLRFTWKALNRMKDPDRFVPIQIIKMAIKYGARSPDPQNTPGLVRVFIRMLRDEKVHGLEVVYRESDNTVMHVMSGRQITK